MKDIIQNKAVHQFNLSDNIIRTLSYLTDICLYWNTSSHYLNTIFKNQKKGLIYFMFGNKNKVDIYIQELLILKLNICLKSVLMAVKS